MGMIEICISFQVAILGISTPILIQAITNLDKKYASLNIINLFKREISYNYFIVVLITSLLITASYLTVNLYFDLNHNTVQIINHFLSGSIPVATAILVVSFLAIVHKVLIYYTPDSLFTYLWKRDVTDDKLFSSFADVYHFIIQSEIDKQAWEVTKEIFNIFIKYQEESKSRLVQYPEHLYEFVEKTVDKLIKIKNRLFTFLDYRAAGGLWYLGRKDKFGIHEDTYSSMWRIMISTLGNNRHDMATHLWKNLHQYSMFDIRSIPPEYDFSSFDQGPLNKKEILNREIERERLSEFTTALGGLAMYLQNYNMIRYMFDYTNSEPPKYELLPSSMDEIFYLFLNFRNSYRDGYYDTIRRYYFPNIDGMKGEKILINWISRYVALLFIRQYTLHQYLSIDRPLDLPKIPTTQSEKKLWLNHLDYFNKLVLEILNNDDLKESIGINHIDDDWFVENKKIKPTVFFNDLKTLLEEEYEKREVEQKLSTTKLEKFKESSGEILSKAIDEIKRLYNDDSFDKSVKIENWYSRDITSTMDRKSFLDDIDVPTMNFDTFTAESQARRLKQAVIETFHLANSKSYVLRSDDIFKAVEKIQNQINPDDLIIVNAGIYLPYIQNVLQIDGLKVDSYNGTKIINLNSFTQLTGRAIYILRKEDLPRATFISPEENLIEKFELEPIGKPEYNIFASVIDLHENKELRSELEQSTKQDLSKSVYIYIFNRLCTSFKTNSRIVEIIQYEGTREKGKAINIESFDFEF